MEAFGRLLRKEIPGADPGEQRDRHSHGPAPGAGVRLSTSSSTAAPARGTSRTSWRRKIAVVLGQVSHPYVSNEEIPDKQDYPPVDERIPGQLVAAGVKVAIASFSRAFGTLAPAGTGKWLLIDAAIAAGYGMTEQDILRAVTLVPAEILGVADRVGASPRGRMRTSSCSTARRSIKTWVERVYVNGELVHQRKP